MPIVIIRELVAARGRSLTAAASIDISGMAATTGPRVTLHVCAIIYGVCVAHTLAIRLPCPIAPRNRDLVTVDVNGDVHRGSTQPTQPTRAVELHGASRAPRRTRQWKWSNQRMVRRSVYPRLTRFTSIIVADSLIAQARGNFSLQRYITLISNIFLPPRFEGKLWTRKKNNSATCHVIFLFLRLTL